MTRILQQYKIAAGYNVSANSLVNIESIIPSSDRNFFVLRSFGTYDPGVIRIKSDGLDYEAGYPSIQWVFSVMTFAQYKYLKDTYCSGRYRGATTINTKLNDNTSYVRRNAIIVVPKEFELTKHLNGYENVPIGFTRIRTAS